jgi:hypothetical protein
MPEVKYSREPHKNRPATGKGAEEGETNGTKDMVSALLQCFHLKDSPVKPHKKGGKK